MLFCKRADESNQVNTLRSLKDKLFIAAIASIAFFMPLDLVCGNAPYVRISGDAVPLGVTSSSYAPLPMAAGKSVKKNKKAEIDYSNSADGYIMAKYMEDGKEIRAVIKSPGGASYTYEMQNAGVYEVFPLSEGNGNYHVSIYENLKGTKYSTVLTVTVTAALKDEFSPFLRPNQYVNYSSASETVKKAAEMTRGSTSVIESVTAVYNFVTDNIKYDKQLAATVQSGYLSNVDAILKSGKGICFDYAAVMASMLRSCQIPTKLVVGYAGKAYHAWINVYSEETGWINAVVYFDGSSWVLMDPTFAAGKTELPSASYAAKLKY